MKDSSVRDRARAREHMKAAKCGRTRDAEKRRDTEHRREQCVGNNKGTHGVAEQSTAAELICLPA